MKQLQTLIRHEFITQNRIYCIIKYLLLFLVFSNLFTLILPTNSEKYSVIFMIIYLPFMFINFSIFIIKPDIEDGTLELLKTTFEIHEIVLAKFGSMFISALIAILLNIPIVSLFLKLNLYITLLLSLVLLLLLISTISLVLLISAIQAYFKCNTHFFTAIILPLLIPNLIIAGILLQNQVINLKLLGAMLGINCILSPLSIIFTCYLMRNIYNTSTLN